MRLLNSTGFSAANEKIETVTSTKFFLPAVRLVSILPPSENSPWLAERRGGCLNDLL